MQLSFDVHNLLFFFWFNAFLVTFRKWRLLGAKYTQSSMAFGMLSLSLPPLPLLAFVPMCAHFIFLDIVEDVDSSFFNSPETM